MVKGVRLRGLYRGLDCPSWVSTQSLTQAKHDPVPFHITRAWECPVCDKVHSYIFVRSVLVDTPKQVAAFEKYMEDNNIVMRTY